ncbi:MAG TPA: DUF6580 family putative transport protein [Verrucomicrobiae bacterium]|nr:DUF6580 family putative transport protein [Verrucomicrobiae bacterium]
MNRFILPIIFIAIFAVSRIPKLFPPDFSAVYALAFCAGVYFRGAMAWWLPLAVVAATDIGLNVFYYHISAVNWVMLVNYAIYAGLIGMGKWIGKSAPLWKLLFGGVLGALLFYLLTNTLSWLQDPGYAKSIAGWIHALFTGMPGYPPSWEFFRNTLLSGGLFTALFAGAAKVTEESPADKTAGAAENNEEEPANGPAAN